MPEARIIPVILSEGSGTRLWPLSREKHPKQMQPLLDDESLLQNNVSRLRDIGWQARTPLREGIPLAYQDFLARNAG